MMLVTQQLPVCCSVVMTSRSSPCLLVFQPLRVLLLDPAHQVSLACLTLLRALGAPQVLALQWLFQEALLLLQVLALLAPLLVLCLLETHGLPGIQQEMKRKRFWKRNELCSMQYMNKRLTSPPDGPLTPGSPLSPFSPLSAF